MSKNIALFSDGTNNQGGNGRDTNVWRLYNLLETDHKKIKQIAFYDDGVGTFKSTPLKIAGLAFGWGLSQNVRDLYVYLASHYEDGDDIYLFGFSRGSFTVRMLANLIDFAGLPVGDDLKSKPKHLKELSKKLLKDYKKHISQHEGIYSSPEKISDVRKLDAIDGKGNKTYQFNKVPIRCMGVWDTVNSTGTPINEIRKIVFCLYPWVQDKTIYNLPDCVKTGFHALAVDEARKSFSPTLWNEHKLKEDQYVEQVWFAGVHSNVGGGYPKDSLAQISLEWLIKRLQLLPKLEKDRIEFNNPVLEYNSKLKMLNAEANVNGKLYDSRAGLAAFYRYKPRDVKFIYQKITGDEVPFVHESVFQRIENATDFYAPIYVHEFKRVDNENLEPEKVESHLLKTKINDDEDSIVDILHCINARVILYWLFVTLSLTAIMIPVLGFHWGWFGEGNELPLLSSVINVLTNFLPDFASDYVLWFSTHSLLFVIILACFVLLRFMKKRLESRLSNVASDMWQNLNKELLGKLIGNLRVTLTKDLKVQKREVGELNDLEKGFMGFERMISRKFDLRSDKNIVSDQKQSSR